MLFSISLRITSDKKIYRSDGRKEEKLFSKKKNELRRKGKEYCLINWLFKK